MWTLARYGFMFVIIILFSWKYRIQGNFFTN